MGDTIGVQIRPQPGPQWNFCACTADIAIYGGTAGSGKSWALLFEGGRNTGTKGYGGIIFRRTAPELRGIGGLWDESADLYPYMGGTPRENTLEWRFPSGARIEMSHLQYDKDVKSHQGRQYAYIGMDEVTHFSEYSFWYIISRNRSKCGVRPYFRGTCNPDPDSHIRGLIDWWIDGEGYPIPERSGVIRWFVRDEDDSIRWFDSKKEAHRWIKKQGYSEKNEPRPLSFTFIMASLDDNPALESKDPGYRAKLLGLSRVERERLLNGNWNIRPAPGLYFDRKDITLLNDRPSDVTTWVRAWDLAGTRVSKERPDPDWTVGALVGWRADGRLCVADVVRFRSNPGEVKSRIRGVADMDGPDVRVAMWQDPAQAGKSQAEDYKLTVLYDRMVQTQTASKNKITYFSPFSAQAEGGMVDIVKGPWNESYFNSLEQFPDGPHDDDVDATSLGYLMAPRNSGPDVVVSADYDLPDFDF